MRDAYESVIVCAVLRADVGVISTLLPLIVTPERVTLTPLFFRSNESVVTVELPESVSLNGTVILFEAESYPRFAESSIGPYQSVPPYIVASIASYQRLANSAISPSDLK